MRRALKTWIAASMTALMSLGASEPWVVGTASGYAPFVSLSDEGELEGFDVDVAREIAQRMDRELQLNDMGTLPTLCIALKQKKIDSMIWAVSITPERQKAMRMIHYQGSAEDAYPLLFWKEIPEGISSIEDLQEHPEIVVAVEAGSAQEDFLDSLHGISSKKVDTVVQGLMDLCYGKVQALLIEPSLEGGFRSHHPELQVLSIQLPEEARVLGNGICVRPEDQALAQAIEAAVAAMKQDGTIRQLEERWGLTP